MMLFRSQRSRVPTAALLGNVERQLDSLRRTRNPSRDAIVHALIDGGELASAVADSFAPERDTVTSITDRYLELVVQLAAAADASWCRSSDRTGAAIERAALSLAGCRVGDLPPTVEIGVSEGFAYYAVGPELYGDAARWFAAQEQPRSAWCIGLRTIGLTLAASVAAALAASGVHARMSSLRPRGHPFDRHPVADEAFAAALAGGRDTWWLVVDEGPGISGSSIAGTATFLTRLGIPSDRIVLMPSYRPDVEKLAACARPVWQRHRVYAADFDRTWIETGRLAAAVNAATVHDVGAGLWRRLTALDDMPAVHPHHERRKYIARRQDGNAFVKFAGLGHYGATVVARSEEAANAGWAPRPDRVTHGWIEFPWIASRFGVSTLTAGILGDFAKYIGFIARTRQTQQQTDPATVKEMMVANTRVICGDAAALAVDALSLPPLAAAVVVDGRLRPHEWLPYHRSLRKTDGCEHGDDHFFPGPCDIAWDVAAVIEEWTLSAEATDYFVRRCIRACRDRGLPDRIPFYRAAYLSFRAAYSAFSRDQLQGTIEATRFAAEHQRYKAQLEAVIPCAC